MDKHQEEGGAEEAVSMGIYHVTINGPAMQPPNAANRAVLK
jgi:hypothetical protein